MARTRKIGGMAVGVLCAAGCAFAPSRPNPLDFAVSEPGVVSPDGQEIYFSGAGHVWKLSKPMGTPERLTSGETPQRVLDTTADGRFLIVELGSRDNGSSGLYFMPVTGGAPVKIFHESGIRPDYVAGDVAGKGVFYTTSDRKLKSFALCLHDLETGKRDVLFSGKGDWFVADVMSDARFLLGRTRDDGSNEYYDWNLAQRELQPVLGQRASERYEVKFGRGAGELLVLSAGDGPTKRLFRSRDGKLDRLAAREDADLVGLLTDSRRFRFYFSWLDTGRTRWEALDGSTFEPVEIVGVPFADVVRVGRPSRFGRFIGILAEDTAPFRQSHFVYDWMTSTLTEWSAKRSF